jgi:hypothetical protein
MINLHVPPKLETFKTFDVSPSARCVSAASVCRYADSFSGFFSLTDITEPVNNILLLFKGVSS